MTSHYSREICTIINSFACNAFVNSLEKYWRHSFRKSLWKYCEKWLPRPFRPWLILTTIFFPMLTPPQYHILKYVIVTYLIRKAKLTLLVPKYTSLRACRKFVPSFSKAPPIIMKLEPMTFQVGYFVNFDGHLLLSCQVRHLLLLVVMNVCIRK